MPIPDWVQLQMEFVNVTQMRVPRRKDERQVYGSTWIVPLKKYCIKMRSVVGKQDYLEFAKYSIKALYDRDRAQCLSPAFLLAKFYKSNKFDWILEQVYEAWVMDKQVAHLKEISEPLEIVEPEDTGDYSDHVAFQAESTGDFIPDYFGD